MKLRHEFVLKALEPDANISELCREIGISRKTGYKWVERFRERGLEGLQDLSRRPHRSPLRASGEAVMRLLELRGAHPRWGPKKLRVVLGRELDADEVPSVRTISRILERAGEVRARRRGWASAARDAGRGAADLQDLAHRVPARRVVMFVVLEIHPFVDGNGRLARAMMNAELASAGEHRILIVTSYRTDYLGALRRLSRAGDPVVYLRMLDRAQEFASRLDYDDLDRLLAVLAECNAFDDTDLRIMKLPPKRPR